MLHDKIYRLYNWCSERKKAIYLVVLILALGRFFYLNYINFSCGALCTGNGGVQYSWDSDRYINGAEMYKKHLEFSTYEYRNIGYIFLIAFMEIAGLNLSVVLIIQLLIALIAALAIYDIGRSVSESRLIGLLASSLYLINPFMVQWHLFIHTESLYSSMLIISVWTIYKAVSKRKSGFYFLAFIAVLFTASLRPNGWIVIPVFFFFAIISWKINLKIKIISIVSVFLIFILVVSYGLNYRNDLKDVNAHNNFIKGEVIWGHPETAKKMPEDVNSDNSDFISAMKYIIKHPVDVIKIAFLRITSELLPIDRSWISAKFIIRFLLWMLPVYMLSVIGFIFYRKKTCVRIMMFIVVAHLCIIGMTCADQEFRFLTYILPQFCIIALLGLNVVFRQVLKADSKSKEFV